MILIGKVELGFRSGVNWGAKHAGNKSYRTSSQRFQHSAMV